MVLYVYYMKNHLMESMVQVNIITGHLQLMTELTCLSQVRNLKKINYFS